MMSDLTRRMREERAHGPYQISVVFDLDTAIYLIANLQLALRHPHNRSEPAQVARRTVDALIQRLRWDGYPAHAELASLGDQPELEFAAMGEYRQ